MWRWESTEPSVGPRRENPKSLKMWVGPLERLQSWQRGSHAEERAEAAGRGVSA